MRDLVGFLAIIKTKLISSIECPLGIYSCNPLYLLESLLCSQCYRFSFQILRLLFLYVLKEVIVILLMLLRLSLIHNDHVRLESDALMMIRLKNRECLFFWSQILDEYLFHLIF